ncbi:MAG: thermonuclease family protein [SAR324 cluster bacterium]|nr:thermonuclease family protein [SAR324 cluster bacterium]
MATIPILSARSCHHAPARTLAVAALALSLCAAPALAPRAAAHPGDLDRYGGHFSDKSGEYHYHRPRATMNKRKKEFLTWVERGRTGEIRGKVVKIERPDAVWVHIPYRPAYQDLHRVLTSANRNAKDQLVKVWFLHASPEASANLGKKYNQWFRKKVSYELGQKLIGKDVVVQFRIVQKGQRVYAMIFMGKENINLWLVLNGWSYYLLNQGENPIEEKFVRAEDLARKRKVGLWRRAR